MHTAAAALATGTAQGGLSAGTTAYTIPKIDEYLKEQGFDETVRHSALLALSAGIGATVGDSTASTANNVGQTEWNYLSHRQLQDKISCVGTKKDCAAHVAKYDEISRQQDEQLKNICSSNPNSTSCHLMIQDALEYVGKNRNHYGKASDIKTSTQNVLSVANSSGYHTINTLDERANYFGAMYGYTEQPWFGVAEEVSRTDLVQAEIAGFKSWVRDAGKVIMKNGKSEFQWIYQNYHNAPANWSDQRLVNEQTDRELQNVHQSYYHRWHPATQFLFNKKVGFTPSEIDPFLDPRNRIHKGRNLIEEFKRKYEVR